MYPAPELLTTAANKPDQDPPEEISNINETLVEGRKVPLITKITLRQCSVSLSLSISLMYGTFCNHKNKQTTINFCNNRNQL